MAAFTYTNDIGLRFHRNLPAYYNSLKRKRKAFFICLPKKFLVYRKQEKLTQHCVSFLFQMKYETINTDTMRQCAALLLCNALNVRCAAAA